MEDKEIAGVVVGGGFGLDKELGVGLVGSFVIKGQMSDRLSDAWRAWRLWREPIAGRGIDSRKGRKG